MDWYSVRIPGKRSAAAWMALARSLHEDAGFPQGCSVHHEIAAAGQNFLYFSPECANVFGQLLKLLGATACEKPAAIESFTEVLHRTPQASRTPQSVPHANAIAH